MRAAYLPPIVLAALVCAVPLGAQEHTPNTGLLDREIKALSADQVDGFLTGAGMGFALAAELNGYPGPRHVLDLTSELGLTEDQTRAIEAIRAEMHAEAVWLGAGLVTRERELDTAFARGEAEAAEVERLTADIGRLNGRLRNAHMRAHLRTTEVLTEYQIHRYAELRGYGGHGHHPEHDHL